MLDHPYRVHIESTEMVEGASQEKVTVNLTAVDLGRLEVLVDQGLYSSRSDAIRTSVRRVLEHHAATVASVVSEGGLRVGSLALDRRALEDLVASGGRFDGGVVGSLRIADDVTPEMALSAVSRLVVYGVARVPTEVADVLKEQGRLQIRGSLSGTHP